jgi:mRNA interferase MazF
MDLVIRRFEVYLINLDPTIGKEIKKTRPCLIISPDDMNKYISTIIIAPMTTKGRNYPTRIPCQFDGKDGQIVLDQIRTVDKIRIIRKLGKINTSTQKEILTALTELFSE